MPFVLNKNLHTILLPMGLGAKIVSFLKKLNFMNSRKIEALVGAFVLVIAIAFFWYAYMQTRYMGYETYPLKIQFTSAEGLIAGSSVNMNGVPVGTVNKVTIDPNSYMADVTIHLNTAIKVPVDSRATISSQGILGGKYLSIVPGNAETYLPHGGMIEHSTPGFSLESIVTQFVSRMGSKE
jgi:phospholipid/cholesterol/gamma-HCH transport system substrate-binding protein